MVKTWYETHTSILYPLKGEGWMMKKRLLKKMMLDVGRINQNIVRNILVRSFSA